MGVGVTNGVGPHQGLFIESGSVIIRVLCVLGGITVPLVRSRLVSFVISNYLDLGVFLVRSHWGLGRSLVDTSQRYLGKSTLPPPLPLPSLHLPTETTEDRI